MYIRPLVAALAVALCGIAQVQDAKVQRGEEQGSDPRL